MVSQIFGYFLEFNFLLQSKNFDIVYFDEWIKPDEYEAK